MGAILAVVMVVVVLTVEGYLLWRRRGRPDASRGELALVSDSGGARNRADRIAVFFHPGHSWARVASGNTVEVGASDFASNFAGSLEGIELPRVGQRLQQGGKAWTLVATSGRRLDQLTPVGGQVVEVNDELVRDPSRIQRSPYGSGWVLRLRPRRLREDLGSLMQGALAKTWMDAVRSRVAERFRSSVGTLAADGGTWVAAFGDRLDDTDWLALKDDLFPSEDPDAR